MIWSWVVIQVISRWRANLILDCELSDQQVKIVSVPACSAWIRPCGWLCVPPEAGCRKIESHEIESQETKSTVKPMIMTTSQQRPAWILLTVPLIFIRQPYVLQLRFQARRVIVVHRFDCILFMRLKVLQKSSSNRNSHFSCALIS